MRNSRPLHIPNLGQPPPKPTASLLTRQPKLNSTPSFFPQRSPLPMHQSHLPFLPQPRTLCPQHTSHLHLPLPPPFPTSSPTQTRHNGSTPTSYPPHRLTSVPLQRDHQTSRPPLGAHPRAPAPKHHQAQQPPLAPASTKAGLPHMPSPVVAPLCQNHEPLLPLIFNNHCNRPQHTPPHRWLHRHPAHTTLHRHLQFNFHTLLPHLRHPFPPHPMLGRHSIQSQNRRRRPSIFPAITTGQPWTTPHLQQPHSPAATRSRAASR